MRNYDYIPLPELRRQYQYRNKLKRVVEEVAIEAAFMAIYGISLGLMLIGLWFEF